MKHTVKITLISSIFTFLNVITRKLKIIDVTPL